MAVKNDELNTVRDQGTTRVEAIAGRANIRALDNFASFPQLDSTLLDNGTDWFSVRIQRHPMQH